MLPKTKTLFIAIGCLTQTASTASGSSAWGRGCNDAKTGSYDRSGNAGKAYQDGWNARH
jgi:hypothetical protein